MTTTTADLFPKGKRRGPTATLRLASAYDAVFRTRKPMVEDLDLVMADLAEFSGYFAACPPGTSNEVLQNANGRREVFARILSLIQLPMYQLTELRNAALVEMQINNEESER